MPRKKEWCLLTLRTRNRLFPFVVFVKGITANIFCLVFPEVTVTSQIVKEHTNATFQCFVSGIPQPNVTWSHNGTVLPASREVIQGSVANVSVSLKLVNVTNEFEGNYTCSASSVSGVVNKSAELIVDGMRYFPFFTY